MDNLDRIGVIHDEGWGRACLYDTHKRRAFGPVIDGTVDEDAGTMAAAFAQWLEDEWTSDHSGLPGEEHVGRLWREWLHERKVA
jgi:hypothetical protein